MPNINAALGLAQLEKLSQYLAAQRQIAEAYIEFFSNLNQKKFVSICENNLCASVDYKKEPPGSLSNYWLNCILFGDKNERDAFLKFSNDNSIMTRPAWRLMNELEMFKDCQTDGLENAKWIADRLVNIPSSVFISTNLPR